MAVEIFFKTIFKKEMSHLMRKRTICIVENKDADQLRGNRKADQRLCFRYSESTIFLNRKFQTSTCLLWPYSPVCVGPVQNHIVGFLMRRLKCVKLEDQSRVPFNIYNHLLFL